eukprot:PhM_4_TR7021/c0_g1_i1/m.75866/K14408/CSTF3, RNA14; cleavage stimulation factor subunit 3
MNEPKLPLYELWRIVDDDHDDGPGETETALASSASPLREAAERLVVDPYSASSWNVLLHRGVVEGRLPLETRRDLMAHFRRLHPTAYTHIAVWLRAELAAGETAFVRGALRAVLPLCHSVDLWTLYIDMLAQSNAKKDAMRKALAAALSEVGVDPSSTGLWRRQIALTENVEERRALYHRCVVSALQDVSGLLSELLAFERTVGEGKAISMSDEAQQRYRCACAVVETLQSILAPFYRHKATHTARPFGPRIDAAGARSGFGVDNDVYDALTAWVRYETCDPLQLLELGADGGGRELYVQRVHHALHMLVSTCPHQPSSWLQLVKFQSVNVGPGAALATAERARAMFPKSLFYVALWALHYAQAKKSTLAAADIMSKVVAEIQTFADVCRDDSDQATLATMLVMQVQIALSPTPADGAAAAKRTALGMIKAGKASWQLFAFLAEAELRTTRDATAACRILQTAERQIGVDNAAFVHRMADLMVHASNVLDVNAILEKAIQRAETNGSSAGVISGLWGRFMEVLKAHTPLWRLPKYEARRFCAAHGMPLPTNVQQQNYVLHGPTTHLIAIERYTTMDGHTPLSESEHNVALEKQRLWVSHDDAPLQHLQVSLGMRVESGAVGPACIPRHRNPFAVPHTHITVPNLTRFSSFKPPKNPNPPLPTQDQNSVSDTPTFRGGTTCPYAPPLFTWSDVKREFGARVNGQASGADNADGSTPATAIPRLVQRLLRALPAPYHSTVPLANASYLVQVLTSHELPSVNIGAGRRAREVDDLREAATRRKIADGLWKRVN